MRGEMLNIKDWKTKRPKTTRPVKIPPDELEALNEAVHVQGIVILAQKLDVTVSTIQGWRTRGVPPGRVPDLEEATGVSRQRLKPRLYT